MCKIEKQIRKLTKDLFETLETLTKRVGDRNALVAKLSEKMHKGENQTKQSFVIETANDKDNIIKLIQHSNTCPKRVNQTEEGTPTVTLKNLVNRSLTEQ